MLIIGDVLTGSPQSSISSTLGASYGVWEPLTLPIYSAKTLAPAAVVIG
jgi:hypothetical protein